MQVDAEATRTVLHGRSSSRIARPRDPIPRGLQTAFPDVLTRTGHLPPRITPRAARARPDLHNIKWFASCLGLFVAAGDQAAVGGLGLLADGALALAALGNAQAGWTGVAVTFAR